LGIYRRRRNIAANGLGRRFRSTGESVNIAAGMYLAGAVVSLVCGKFQFAEVDWIERGRQIRERKRPVI